MAIMNEFSKVVVCCGFAPCVQRILEFDFLKKEQVNRALKVSIGIGGKGANTARMVNQLGEEPLLLGFAGGTNGRLLEHLLDKEGVPYKHVEVRGETRICQTLVAQGTPETTELVEEMPPLEENEWSAMIKLLKSEDLSNAVVPACGKLPAGAPVDAYAQVAFIVKSQGGDLIIDAPGEPLLRTLEHRPALVKINDVELKNTLKGKDLKDSCLRMLALGAQSILITRGAKTAFYVSDSTQFEIVPPKIQAINPVGSGDAVTAGIAVAMAQGRSVQEMLIQGMACGAANALNLKSGFLKMSDVKRLSSEVALIPLTKTRWH